jgi:PiT family inorganic phosphate transporter
MDHLAFTLWIFIAIALLFDFLNGFNDSANIVATMIASRAMTPARALLIAAIFEFLGPFVFGVAVATTIGHQVVSPDILTTSLVLAALLAAIGWNLFTGIMGIPSSSSHALIGGLVGSACMSNLLRLAGTDFFRQAPDLRVVLQVIRPEGLGKVIFSLLVSPILGLGAGFLLIKITYALTRHATPGINRTFRRVQLLTSIILALSHGGNDAQKTMALIAMALLANGVTAHFTVPLWVVASCASAIALGTAVGGRRQIKTIGRKFYAIRPIHGFATQLSSALLIIMASLLGGPVSTTHVVSTAVMGAGSAERLSKVRWGVGRQIVTAWALTMPVTALLAALVYLLVRIIPGMG